MSNYNWKIIYKPHCTTVYECYKLSNKEIEKVSRIIVSQRKLKDLLVTRTAKSYASEIKAHKKAYKLGIMKSHSKDADLEEPIKKQREIFYRIVGL